MSMWWARVVNTIPGDCLASFAIRCSRVEMESELGLSGIFPSNGSVSWRPLPSTGSLGTVPPLHRYSGALRLLPIRPRTLRSSLAARYPSPTVRFRSSGWHSRKASPRPGPISTVEPSVFSCGRWRGLPGSWGSLDSVPRSTTPARGDRLGRSAGGSCGLPSFSPRRPSRLAHFGAPIRSPLPRCLRFAAGVAPGLAQDSLPTGPT
jgi:hypothetical protein